jgi:protein TonB
MMTRLKDTTTRTYGMLDDVVAEHKRVRNYAPSMVLAILLHALLIFLLIWRPLVLPDIEAAAGPPGDGGVAGGGGGDNVVAIMELPPAMAKPEIPEEPVIPEPVPVVEPEPIVPDVPLDTVPRPATPTPAPASPVATTGTDAGGGSTGTGGGTGGGSGTGAGPGTGSGVGPGDGTGTGGGGTGAITAPSPRGLTLPPSDRPGKVRGKTVTVFVFVSDRGRVVSDSTRLDKSSGDSKFDNRIKQQAAEWQFRPGMRAGVAIATWFQYTLTL